MLNHHHRTRLQLRGSPSPLATTALPGRADNDNAAAASTRRGPAAQAATLELPWRVWSDLAAPVITPQVDLAAATGRLATREVLLVGASMWRLGVAVSLAGSTACLALIGLAPSRG